MDHPISVLGVFLAAASAFVVGSIWYGPKTFFPLWSKIVGADDAHMKKNFAPSMAYHGVAALLTAYVLAHFTSYTMQVTGASGILGGMTTAFWAWLGISLTTLITSQALDPRDKKLILIQGGDRFVTLMLMGLILGAFM